MPSVDGDSSDCRSPGHAKGVIIISSQPAELPWHNAELVVARSDEELAAAVAGFKRQPGRDLGVPGGVRTAQRFARLGLIDEYVLHVHPVAIGVGQPLFTQKISLKLVSAKTYDSGVMQLRYRPAQPAAQSLPASP